MTANIVRISISHNPDLNMSPPVCCNLASEKISYYAERATYQPKIHQVLPFRMPGWCEGKGEAEGRFRLHPPLHNKVASTATTRLQKWTCWRVANRSLDNIGQDKALLGSVGGARSVTVHSGRGNGWLVGWGEKRSRATERGKEV